MPRKKKSETEDKPLEKVSKTENKEVVETAEKEEKEKVDEPLDIAIDVFSQQAGTSSESSEAKTEKQEVRGEAKEEKPGKEEEKPRKKTKKEELLERAKQLGAEIGEKVELKEQLIKIKEKEKERAKTLIPLEDYVKYSVHLGTKVITPHMRKFVYRRRADGIAIINTNSTDKLLKEAADFLSKYKPEDVILVCKREAGWRALEKFSQVTGIRIFTKKYPAGIITNSSLPNFFETELVVVCDPWLDKNAMHDAKNIKRKVLALCDTNNYTFGVDCIIPCNNKSNKSIGLILQLLAKEYLKERGIEKEVPSAEDFAGEKIE